MTSARDKVGFIVDPHCGIERPACCEKCGGPLQYRRIIVSGEVQWIWQCRTCRFHYPAEEM
ncbi:MAG TPA: hypothetical protein VKK79_16905 [Candidatus Lokiarchaeia archaeon]|nr:hypothetical protein [Candidatus Lokiarchaeia archaeon]